MDDPVIVQNLVKNFGNVKAVDNLSFKVREKEIYGLLGPNGAGKTTTVKTILGILEPTSGESLVFGKSPQEFPIEVKSKIGYVPEDIVLYDSLSPKEFFNFISSVRKLENYKTTDIINRLVKAFEIESFYETPSAALSHGTKQKVAVIGGFFHEPQLLILDEPLIGLDARSSRIFKDLLNIHLENGGSVLFSTHIMEVAETLCNRVGIIHKGSLVAEGTVSELRSLLKKSDASLEQIFLQVTEQDTGVAETVKMLREAFKTK
ncbi:MAG: ABC transporter ATP-binding protein [Candidatus Ranarchaeia archaeon]